MKRCLICLLALFLFACGKSKNSTVSKVPGLSAGNAEYTTTQNGVFSLDLGGAAANVTITGQPAHGRVRLNGNTVTYRSTDPLFSGTDTFNYRFTNGITSSNEGTVKVIVTPLASGTTVHTENYADGAFALGGWRSYSSSTGHTPSSLAGFGAGGRHFRIYGDAASYAGDAVYGALFGVLPIDGSGFAMKDWPWKADLIHVPECGVDATVTAKISPLNDEYPMVAILLNYDIDRNQAGTAQELTGYQVLVNSGGGSLTLSRLNQANELATAYVDRWPNTNYGTEAMANPVVYGPYKGWNYKNGPWPAGGNVGAGGPKYLAVRYQYDTVTKNTKMSYEARSAGGVDATPGAWDVVVDLSGADSLTPGGSFGIMPLNYHTQSLLLTTDFEVSEYKLECALP
jgi:hypothetical protein